MKKLFLILFVVLFTGCINGNRDFETICKRTEEAEGFIEDISYKIYFNSSNDITKLIETYNFKYYSDVGKGPFDSAKASIKSYGNSKKYEVEVVKDTENEYEIRFTLNISKLSDKELEQIGFKRYYYDQMNTYKKNMTCSKK